MSQVKKHKSPENSIPDEERIPQSLFPEIHNLSSLPIDKRLPMLKFKNPEELQPTKKSQITLTVEMPSKIQSADIYLFVNEEKKDMFYNVSSGGKYGFNYINLSVGINLIELFYRTGERKSSPVRATIVRK